MNDTLHMWYACTVLTLTSLMGSRDTVCVSNVSYRDLNGTRRAPHTSTPGSTNMRNTQSTKNAGSQRFSRQQSVTVRVPHWQPSSKKAGPQGP